MVVLPWRTGRRTRGSDQRGCGAGARGDFAREARGRHGKLAGRSRPQPPMTKTRVLTGITTSGTPHLGNYVGAIRPALRASADPAVESFYFLADYHALIKVAEPARVQRSTLEIAAAWLACGLDPQQVWFYRQSDIPEIPELTWLLACVAGKGLLTARMPTRPRPTATARPARTRMPASLPDCSCTRC